jgi:predicted GIY-YIG superfamily endonuclease
MTRHTDMSGRPGVIYMLHFDRPYRHAKHYVGWTDDLFDRLDQHAAGRGARLVAVIWHAGIGFTLIRICEGTRATERAIKNDGGAVRYCPACTPRPWTGHWSAMPGGFTPPQLSQPRRKAVTPDAQQPQRLWP